MLPLYVEIKKKERYVDASKHRDFVFSLFSIVICFISLVEFVVAAIEAIIRDIEINIDSLEIVSLVLTSTLLFFVDVFSEKIWLWADKKDLSRINKVDKTCVTLSIILFVGTDIVLKLLNKAMLLIMLLIVLWFVGCWIYGAYKRFQSEKTGEK